MTERSSELEGGYRIVVGAAPQWRDALVRLWSTEARMAAETIEERLEQVLLLALDPSDQIAGVSTTYLCPYEPFLADFWFSRVFVARAHRLGSLALKLTRIGCEVLGERYVSGEDRRGLGVLYVIQNSGLMTPGSGATRFATLAHWERSDFWYVGDSPQGHHLRVHYFPGVHAPEPPGP